MTIVDIGKEQLLSYLPASSDSVESAFRTGGRVTHTHTDRLDLIFRPSCMDRGSMQVGRDIDKFKILSWHERYICTVSETSCSFSFSGLVSVLGWAEPSVVRSATGTAPRWVTPASRAHSRSFQVLEGVMLGSQGMLCVGLLLLYILAIRE
ncbi:jg9594 [Pararge aegeria aegeria]|uniref:Jg9594 protein n=1 Tax=Pararge aegeria aegeria TaxID=348720 RepID=A0A8S4S3X9_9NEOP|nr:jg9594 [Pararge aegeria aegeria]